MRRAMWVAVIAGPLLALLAFGLRGNPNAAASPLLNKPAPNFSLRTLDDRTLSLAALRGRPVVLNFWASWCPSCKIEHAALRDAWRRYRTSVQFVGVLFQDTRESARQYMVQHGGQWPSGQDPDQRVAIDYGVAGPPETYFVDRRGIVRFKVIGPVSRDVLYRDIRKLVRMRR
jgi:cytochrome c biogenesis protein CcmG, thiol:disulfide interchange protein DsbE